MRHNISADRVLFFKKRKKSNLNLSQISVLATEARNNIDENQQLSDAITILNNLLQKTKKIIKTLISKKNISKIEIENNLKEEKYGQKKLNKILRGEKNFIRLKYNKTNNELNQVIKPLENELDILNNRKFIYENALFEKQSIINKIKNEITQIKLNREDTNEKYISCGESNKIFDKINDSSQTMILNEGKLFNKYENINIKFLENKKLLLDEIQNIYSGKKNSYSNIIYISSYNDDSKYEADSYLNESITSTLEEEYMYLPFIQNELQLSMIEKNKVRSKFRMTNLLLEQIKYNNERVKPDEVEKSLSRIMEKNKGKDSKEIKIKKLKEKINRVKKRIQKKEVMCKQYEDKKRSMEFYIQNYDTIKKNHKENISIDI
jgi:hypothetical protein